jgi:hypothetical protein
MQAVFPAEKRNLLAFSLTTLSTNNDLSHKTTFGSQKQAVKTI